MVCQKKQRETGKVQDVFQPRPQAWEMNLTRKREENAGEKAFKKTAFRGLTLPAGLGVIKVY